MSGSSRPIRIISILTRVSVFGLALARYSVDRLEWERITALCTVTPCYAGDHIPNIGDPFKLLCAAALLLINKWWANLITLMISGTKVYELTVTMWVSCSHMEMCISGGASIFECWLTMIAFRAPHLGADLIVAFTVFVTSAFSLVLFVGRADCVWPRLR